MNRFDDLDQRLAARIPEIAAVRAPDDLLATVLERTVTLPQARRGLFGWPRSELHRFAQVVALAVVIAAAAFVGLQFANVRQVGPPAPVTPSPSAPSSSGLPATIYFHSNRSGAMEIHALSPDGTVTRLTSDPAKALSPAISPDRKTVAFTSTRAGDRAQDIWLVNADGTDERNLTNSPNSIDALAAWSPDGLRIAFLHDDGAGSEIYVINADGSGVTNLTNLPVGNADPAWSPDGTRIASRSHRQDEDGDVYVMNADGSNVVRLTDAPGMDGSPAWSPDGTRIAFVSNRDGNAEIYVMNADGSGQTNLTNHRTDDWSPAWSPDGAWIAWTASRDGAGEIYVMRADGSDVRNVTNDRSADEDPDWGP